MMRAWACAFALCAGSAVCQAQWELGATGGYSFRRDFTIESPAGSISAGVDRGVAWGFFAGLTEYGYLGGEVHYRRQTSNFRLKSPGAELAFPGRTHVVHFDFLVHAAKSGSRVRPFLAVGGGVKVFEGKGVERSGQPFSRFAAFANTRETKPLFSPGVGVKLQVADHLSVRFEFRDYITPVPEKIIAPVPGAKTSGVLHDLTPAIGIAATF